VYDTTGFDPERNAEIQQGDRAESFARDILSDAYTASGAVASR
jgi:hypothetical protein